MAHVYLFSLSFSFIIKCKGFFELPYFHHAVEMSHIVRMYERMDSYYYYRFNLLSESEFQMNRGEHFFVQSIRLKESEFTWGCVRALRSMGWGMLCTESIMISGFPPPGMPQSMIILEGSQAGKAD